MQVSSKLNQCCKSEIDDHLRNTFLPHQIILAFTWSEEKIRTYSEILQFLTFFIDLPMELSPYPRQPPAQFEMHIRRVTSEF